MKKVVISTLAAAVLFAPKSFGLDGEIIFKDALYGAGIGGLAGGALYLVDSNDFGAKVGIGVLIGLIGGTVIGVYESQGAFVQIENGKIKVAMPQIEVEKLNYTNSTSAKVNLIGANF